MAWNPQGTRIVSGSQDFTLRIWDAATGEGLQTLEGHIHAVESVAWNPKGTRIVSGSVDFTLRIWDAATGESLQTLEGHESYVYSVAWNPQGTRIVSGSFDHTLRIWESRIEEALPLWHAEDLRQQVRPQVDALFEEYVFLDPVLDTLRADTTLSGELRRLALRLAEARSDLSAAELNSRSWDLVDPDRIDKETDVALGLRLARLAVELAHEESGHLDTLAWALFANGLHDEAIAVSEEALELAPQERKADYQGYLDRLCEEAQAAVSRKENDRGDDR